MEAFVLTSRLREPRRESRKATQYGHCLHITLRRTPW
jgi:hypothetical protein